MLGLDPFMAMEEDEDEVEDPESVIDREADDAHDAHSPSLNPVISSKDSASIY